MPRATRRETGFSSPNKSADARTRASAAAIAAIEADPVLAFFVAFLAKLPLKRRRAATLSFDFWWNELRPQERATIVRSYRSTASEGDIARWSGVSERSLHRWAEYKLLRRNARRDWPVGYKNRSGQIDTWKNE